MAIPICDIGDPHALGRAQRGKLIDGRCASNPRAPLRLGARHAGVPFAGFWPDHRVGIELPQSTRIVQRKRGPTSNVDSMMVLRARRGGTGSK